MLNHIGYDGPISIEWEDAGMDRLAGAPEALDFIRTLNAIRPDGASSTQPLPQRVRLPLNRGQARPAVEPCRGCQRSAQVQPAAPGA